MKSKLQGKSKEGKSLLVMCEMHNCASESTALPLFESAAFFTCAFVPYQASHVLHYLALPFCPRWLTQPYQHYLRKHAVVLGLAPLATVASHFFVV